MFICHAICSNVFPFKKNPKKHHIAILFNILLTLCLSMALNNTQSYEFGCGAAPLVCASV